MGVIKHKKPLAFFDFFINTICILFLAIKNTNTFMQVFNKVLIFGFLFFFTSNCCAQKIAPKISKPTNSNSTPTLQNSEDSLQYTLGAFLGLWILNNGFTITNASLFSNGLDNILRNKSRVIPDSTIESLIANYQKAALRGIAVQQEQKLFASIKDMPGIGVLPSGVRYKVLTTGKGARPSEKDTIIIHMLAKLADVKTVVEDTYQTQKPFVTTLSGLFPGLSDPLQLMTEGSKWQLFIPAALAYGEKETTLIPPNSALIIEVELMEVKGFKK